MEAELLRGMIADRDERIGRMERRLLEQQTKHEQVAQALEEVSTENQIARTQLQTERTQCRSTYEEARGNLEHLQRDLQQQGSSLQQAYTTFSKKDPSHDPSYIMRMQAQLCKAMHTLGILDRQVELTKLHAEELSKMCKDKIAQVTNQSTQKELELMNALVVKDTELRAVENAFKEKLDVIFQDISAIREQLGDSDDEEEDEEEDDDNRRKDKEPDNQGEPEDDDDEEEDPEEKEAKEELMKMLQERREKIRKLEKEIEEQEETIAELEEHLAEIDGGLDEAHKQIQAERKTRKEQEKHHKATTRVVHDPDESESEVNRESVIIPDNMDEIKARLAAAVGDIGDNGKSLAELPDDMAAIRNMIANRTKIMEDEESEESDEASGTIDEDDEEEEGESSQMEEDQIPSNSEMGSESQVQEGENVLEADGDNIVGESKQSVEPIEDDDGGENVGTPVPVSEDVESLSADPADLGEFENNANTYRVDEPTTSYIKDKFQTDDTASSDEKPELNGEDSGSER